MTHLHLNPLAIVVAAVVSFALGSLWYGVLFVKPWQRAMGFADDKKPSGGEIAKGSILNVIGTLLMAFVMNHEVLVYRPSSVRKPWKVFFISATFQLLSLVAMAMILSYWR